MSSTIPLRDCQAWKNVGLPMSTSSNEAAKLFDDVINQYVTWSESPDGGIEGTIVKMFEADPNFMMGQALSIGLDLMGTGRAIHLDKEFSDQIKKFQSDMNSHTFTM